MCLWSGTVNSSCSLLVVVFLPNHISQSRTFTGDCFQKIDTCFCCVSVFLWQLYAFYVYFPRKIWNHCLLSRYMVTSSEKDLCYKDFNIIRLQAFHFACVCACFFCFCSFSPISQWNKYILVDCYYFATVLFFKWNLTNETSMKQL